MENGDAGLIVKCTNIKAEKLTDLTEELGGGFTVDNVNLDATIADGTYENITISMVQKYNVAGEKFEADAKIIMDFDYENAKEITAPSDADKYTLVVFDKLFNAW